MRLHIADAHSSSVYDGILPKGAEPADGEVVIFDGTSRGRRGTFYRRRGNAVIGGNTFDRALEVERDQGQRLMRQAGIETPETFTFGDFRSARAFLRHEDGAWYIKFSGEDTPTYATQNQDSSEKMLRWLDYVESLPDFGFTTLSLQRKVEGLEIDCDGWFDGERFVPPFCSTIEDKKAWAGDVGPRVGCAANVVWCWADDAPLPLATVCLLEDQLRTAGYVGNIALNTIVADDGTIYGLEWTARCGFDALQAWHLLVADDLGEQMAAFARGKLDRWEMRPDLALTLRVSTPPWPMDDPDGAMKKKGMPLDERLDGSHPRVLPDDVFLSARGPALAGRDGAVGVVAAVGTDISALRGMVVELADSLDVADLAFRNDPVTRYEKVLARLTDLGLKEAA